MNFGIIDLLKLVGSLGVFLYGMKIMSESLQKVAGDKMRSILSAMTSNRFLGVLTGILITAVIQSSSATTVMIVSFVNAGLLSLVQSVGVIMGANIGTTFTAWLISILGFKVKISAFALPLIGISFPLLFSSNNKRKSWGELIIGFALVFMGLDFLKEAVPDIKNNPEVLAFLAKYAGNGIWSVLLFLSIGTILTIIIQSSSATMALTLVMCNNGWISFDIAAAMVLGENIGTTITANLASVVANISAKRASRIHLLFNLFGVFWVVLIFNFFLKGIDSLMLGWGLKSPFEHVESVPIALSLFHTVFNLLNVIILIGFAPLLVKVSERLVRAKDDEDEEEFHLQHIGFSSFSTSELALLQAKQEIEVYAERVHKMHRKVKDLLLETKSKKNDKKFSKIEKFELANDATEVEIATFLTKLTESDLSNVSIARIQAMLKVINEIESISDANYNLAKTIVRKFNKKIIFSEEIYSNLDKMFDLLEEAFLVMIENIKSGYNKLDLSKALLVESQINALRDKLKKQHLRAIESQEYDYMTGIIYNDMFCECERLGDYIINVSEAIDEIVV